MQKAACVGRATAQLASIEQGRWPTIRCHTKQSLLPSVSRVGAPAASLVWAGLSAHRHSCSTLAALQAPYGPVTDTYTEESVEGYDAELLPSSWTLGREDAFLEQATAEANLNTINENMEKLLRVLRENDAFIQEQQQQQLDPLAQLAKSQLHRAAVEHEGSDGEEEAWFLSPLDKAIMQGHLPSIRKERKQEEKQQRAEKAAKKAQAAAERAVKRAMRRTATAGPLAEPLTAPAPAPASDAASAAAARQLRREQRRASSSAPTSTSALSSSTAYPPASMMPVFEPMPAPTGLPSLPATSNRGGPAETSQALEAEFARSALEASLAVRLHDVPNTSSPSASIVTPRSTSSTSTGSSRDVSTSALGSKQAQQSPVSGKSAMSAAPAAVPLALTPLAPLAVVPQQRHAASTRRGRSPRRTRGNAMQAQQAVASPADASPLGTLFTELNGANVTLLSADEEKELAEVVKDLLMLEAKQVELAKELKRPPTLEEWGATVGMTEMSKFTARLASGRQAKNAMVQRNLRLVVSICKKFVGRGMQLSDLVSEGIAGLLKGVEKFDGSKGFKFSTYAHWWIRQAVGRSVSDQGRMVRLPVHLHEAWTKMRKAEKDLEESLRRRPSFSEIAQHLGWEEDRLQEMYDIVRQPRSMDVPIYTDEGSNLGDVLEDESRMTPDESATADNVKRDVDAMLSELNDREAGVVRMRFGLDDGVEHTLDDIGSRYNVTRERIRQIEAKALRRLRALQTSGKGRLSEYLVGEMEEKSLAARSSGGLKKQS